MYFELFFHHEYLKAACDPKVEGWIKGILLTSPAVHVQPSHPIVMVSIVLIYLHITRKNIVNLIIYYVDTTLYMLVLMQLLP